MTHKQHEPVSALMDGEVDGRQLDDLLKCMYDDHEMRQCWTRYHFIGDALRNNLPNDIQHDLASRVSQALEAEPTILSPVNPEPRSTSHRKLPLTGYALAASVAVIGFVTVGVVDRTLKEKDGQIASATVEPAVTQLAAGSDIQPQPPGAQTRVVKLGESSPQVGSKLQNYVINHEFSSPSVIRWGLPSDVRVVTFETEQ
jgi:sigma-E factor negative regulatory protein RseA